MPIQPVIPPAVVIGEGLPVILLHAFPLDGRIWMPVATGLSDRYQLIVPDLRGFGNASHQLESLTEIAIDLVAEDIAALMDAREIDRAVIGGVSRGGYVALAFARKYPERIAGLMLLDTRANPADDKEHQTYSEMIERIGKEGIAFVPQMMRPRFFGAATLQSNPALVNNVDNMILSQSPEAIVAAARGMLSRSDARPLLSQIQAPTLAIAGVEDGALANTKAIAEGIGGARFVPIAEAGHLPILEQPEAVIAAINEFLAAITG